MLAFSFNNDPTPAGWLIFTAYLFAALLCVGRACHPIAPQNADTRKLRRFWFILAATLLLLGLNKQADLQTSLINFAKNISEYQGWYPHRRIVQWLFTILMAFVALFYIHLLLRLLRPAWRSHLIVLLGLACLLLFLFLRVLDVDRLTEDLDLPSEKSSRLWPLELAGICLIAFASLHPRASHHPASQAL